MNTTWPMIKLGEVVTPVQRSEKPVPGETYRQIGVKLWGEGAYEREPLDGLNTKYTCLFRAAAGDLIVNKIWARNGSVAVVPNALEGTCGSNEFPMFAPRRKLIEPRWMHWITKTSDFWAQCDSKSRGTSGQNRIRPERFLEIEIPVPPLREQRRLLALIEGLAAQLHEARALKQEAKEETDNFWKVLSRMARGTTHPVRRLEEMAEFLDGRRVPLSESERSTRRGRYPYYGASGVIDHIDDYIFDEPLLLLSEDGANLINRSTPIAFVATGKYWVNNHAHVLKPFDGIADLHFLAYALSDCDVSVFNFASAQPKLNQKNARTIQFPLPSLEEQRRIVTELDELRVEVDALKRLQAETATQLGALLPSILDRAFRGEF